MANQYTINNNDSQLWNAIKRLEIAKRKNADTKVLERLEKRVSEEAAKINEKLVGRSIDEVISELWNRK